MWVAGGRVVLGEQQPGDPPLPAELEEAIREWAAFAPTVTRSGGSRERELLCRRGRQLASRVADVLGRPVEFTDPGTGAVEWIHAGATGPVPRLDPEPAGPTPWATGLTVAAFCAVLVAVADIAFSHTLGALALPANLLVGLGLAPSFHLLRHTPFWRWIVLGVAAGLAVAWVVLLLALLG